MSTLDHRPYPKIAARPTVAARGGAWVATEKIHGANLVVATDGAEVRVGKRKAWLEAGEPFFGWQLLRLKLHRAALAVHAAVRASIAPGATIVRVYGELYGGAYPHSNVPPVPGASPVQTGIWYAPDIRFAAFDVFLEPDELFVAHADLERLAAAADLDVVPVLGRGSRADLDRLPVRYPSRVYAALGLPPIDGNLAEGMVLKSAAAGSPDDRSIVKRKIAELDEARFDEALPWDADARLSLNDLATLAARLVNPARVASARSKIGDAAPLADEIALDVLLDLTDAFPRAMRELAPEAEDVLRAGIVAQVGALG
jgi:Rnl2 family RNA ligase